MLQIIVGIVFIALISMDCMIGHCWTKTASDVAVRIYLTGVAVFCTLMSLLLMMVHLLCPPALLDQSKKFRFVEIIYSMSALALYFVARYYCANYYGGPERLEGRWIPLTVAVWTNVVLYIIDAFVVMGVKARCGKGGMTAKAYRHTPILNHQDCV
uniref:MARVEL domain-containing protein n=1 Tax=Plectus sambesii TaxID=2011161 RepID=A0A914V2C6_9BILA